MTAAAPRATTTPVGETTTSTLARTIAAVTGVFGLTLMVTGLVVGIQESLEMWADPFFGTRILIPIVLGLLTFLPGLPYLVVAAVAWKYGSAHPARWAWTAAAFSLFGLLTAMFVEEYTYLLLGVDPGESSGTTAQALTATSAAVAVAIAAPIITVFETFRFIRQRRDTPTTPG